MTSHAKLLRLIRARVAAARAARRGRFGPARVVLDARYDVWLKAAALVKDFARKR